MQEIEIGKISGEAPLDSLINIFLWLDQLKITVDDHASMFIAPRIFDAGDEFKYEKTQITWNGIEAIVHCEKAKAKLSIGQTSARINNLRGNDRAGFLEGNVGAINFILAVLFNNTKEWLQAGVINIPNVSASVEEGYSDAELKDQQHFLRKHDRKTKRLDFLWNENPEETVHKTSMKGDWGCTWFQPDPNSPAFIVHQRGSQDSLEASTLKRGASLLTGSKLLDIEKPFLKKIFNPRITATSIATEDGLSITPRLSDDISTSRGSLRSTNAASNLLSVPDGAGDGQGRQSETSIQCSSLPRGFSRSSRASGVSVRSRDSHVSFREPGTSAKSTASSMTELYFSAVSSSVGGSTDTLDQFYSCSESDEENYDDYEKGFEASVSTGKSREHLHSGSSVVSNRTVDGTTGSSVKLRNTSRSSGFNFETAARSRNSSVSSRKHRSTVRGDRPKPARQRPSDLPLTNIHSPTNPDDDHVPYDQVLPILSETMVELKDESGRKRGLSNDIIQSDPKRAVGFEPESPRGSVSGDSGDRALDRDVTKIDVRLNSNETTSAIDICATPLCLDATNDALDEVSSVCERLHYSSISTILLSRVIKAHYREPQSPILEKEIEKKTSFSFKIDQIKIGLLQISNFNETVFNTAIPHRNIPCTTFVIGWLEHVDIGYDIKTDKKIMARGSFRRLHLQLRANSIDGNEPDGTTIIHLQEAASRPQKSVCVAFKCNEWGWIMAEAGIDGTKMKAEKNDHDANLNMNLDKIWFLAAAPSSLSRATRQWSLLSTASSGVKSWVERFEDISSRMKRLTESIIEQRCKVVVAPLAHRVAMNANENNQYAKMDDGELDMGIVDVLRELNDVKVSDNLSNELPLTESSLQLRRNVAFCAAVTTVQLLAASKFVQEVFRDGSHEAPYFLPRHDDSEQREEDHIPKAATLKRGLLLICQRWQEAAGRYANEHGWTSDSQQETILSPLRMQNRHFIPPLQETTPLLRGGVDDLEMGNLGKIHTINNGYSLPRGGIKSLIHMKAILEYCHVPIANVPERFSSLFKKGIKNVDAKINLSSFQVFIKESERKKRRMGGRQISMLNQPVLKFDQIQLGSTIFIPTEELESVQTAPNVTITIGINEIAQRLDVTLMRLIAQVNGVIEAISRAKMDHRIGRMEERYRDENIHYTDSSVSSDRLSEQDCEIELNDDNLTERSSTATEDAACWRFIYSAVQPESSEDTRERVDTIQEFENRRSPLLSHRSTVKIQEDLSAPAGKFHIHDDDYPNLDTKLKIELSASIRTIRLSADVGGLSLRININALDGKVNLEQLEVLENVQLDAQNRIVQTNRYAVPTTRMGVDVKLKSITIDFIEAQSSTIVLQLDVEKSTFDAQPSSHKNNKVINMKAKIGKINVKLPLMVGQINNVFIRTSRMMGQQLDDFNSFILHSNADLIDIDSAARKHTPPTTAGPLTEAIDGSTISRSSNVIPLAFEVTLKGFFMKVNLLHSITATYEMGPVTGEGDTIPHKSSNQNIMNAKFQIEEHKINIVGTFKNSEKNEDRIRQDIVFPSITLDTCVKKDVHDYLKGNIEIEVFHQDLTTELFNLLVFCFEELRTEVTDIVNKLKNEDPFPVIGFANTATTPRTDHYDPRVPMKYSYG